MSNIDFSDCPRVFGRAYNGANGKKIAVSYKGETWILKFPPNVRERHNEHHTLIVAYQSILVLQYIGFWGFLHRKHFLEYMLMERQK